MNTNPQTPDNKAYGQVICTHNAAHYTWGGNCDSWDLLKTAALSVIEEKMPAGTFEQLHYHHRAQQLFYILSGVATFEINEKIITVNANESISIPAEARHFIANKSSEDLNFLVISQPNSHGDRINIFPNNKP